MLVKRLGLFLAGAAIVAFASAASAFTMGYETWTHMKEAKEGGKDLVFYGHDLTKLNYKWATGSVDLGVGDISEMVWKMDVKMCMAGECETKLAEVWMKSGSPFRYHAFYKVDGQRWQRAHPVPEPTAAAVFALGLGVVGAGLRRRRK